LSTSTPLLTGFDAGPDLTFVVRWVRSERVGPDLVFD